MKAGEVLKELGISRAALYLCYKDGRVRGEKSPNGYHLNYNESDIASLKNRIRRCWSKDNIINLKKYYGQGLSYNEIGKLLNRSPDSIHIKIVRLRLRRECSLTKALKSKNMSGENNPMFGSVAWSRG